MKTILVVDDEEDLCEICQTHLVEEGYQVLTAEDGDVGLQMTKKFKPDLIILDISMPRMNGLEMLELVRHDPELANIHVLMLSAHNQTRNMLTAQQLKAADFMSKPFSRADLVSAVNNLIKC